MKNDNSLIVLKQWDICKFRISSKETEGTEIMKSRPGIIISTDLLNSWRKRYIFLPITSKQTEKIYPFEVSINFKNKEGKALLDQIKTFSHSRLISKLGTLECKYHSEIIKKLKNVLDLED